MDFSTEFVALRDRLIETQDKAFRTQTNVEVAGRRHQTEDLARARSSV